MLAPSPPPVAIPSAVIPSSPFTQIPTSPPPAAFFTSQSTETLLHHLPSPPRPPSHPLKHPHYHPPITHLLKRPSPTPHAQALFSKTWNLWALQSTTTHILFLTHMDSVTLSRHMDSLIFYCFNKYDKNPNPFLNAFYFRSWCFTWHFRCSGQKKFRQE